MGQYFYWRDGREFGPMAFSSLQNLANDGFITPKTPIKIAVSNEWLAAGVSPISFPNKDGLTETDCDMPSQFREWLASQPADVVASSSEIKVSAPPPDAKEYFYQRDGGIYGPLTFARLKELAAQGRVPAFAPVRRGQDGEWKPASQWGIDYATLAAAQIAIQVEEEQTETRQKGIILAVLVIGAVAWLLFALQSENKRVSALSPEEKYKEECAKNGMAHVMAETFIKTKLNIADKPTFEDYTSKITSKVADGPNGECKWAVMGNITFKNEVGGTSRRYASVIVGPTKDDTGRWMLYSFSVR